MNETPTPGRAWPMTRYPAHADRIPVEATTAAGRRMADLQALQLLGGAPDLTVHDLWAQAIAAALPHLPVELFAALTDKED